MTRIVLAAMGALAAFPYAAFAQEFVPLQRTPGVIDTNVDFSTFVNGLFWLSITVGAVLAVLMIAIGGFHYIGSESYSSKEEGIKYIQAAVGGLILLLLTFVIFTTINPDILKLNQKIQPIEVNLPDRQETQQNDPSFTTGDVDPAFKKAFEEKSRNLEIVGAVTMTNPNDITARQEVIQKCAEAFPGSTGITRQVSTEPGKFFCLKAK